MTALGALATPPPQTISIGNATLTNSLIVATSPVKLYTLCGYNNGPAQYVMLFQTNAVPNNGMLAKHSFAVGAQQNYSFDFSFYGEDLDTLAVANSTTPDVLTLGTTNCSFQAILAR